MIVVIDNYDSFTFNLVQFVGELGADPRVWRNDEIEVEEIGPLAPNAIIISPGPGRPEDAGISVAVVRSYSDRVPILGVCLGHQAIGAAFGARVGRTEPVHGKASDVSHDGTGIFEGVPNPFRAGRYHSLVVESDNLPASLGVTATSSEGLIMGVRHREHPTWGVQFHPESILTGVGKKILGNFLRGTGEIES